MRGGGLTGARGVAHAVDHASSPTRTKRILLLLLVATLLALPMVPTTAAEASMTALDAPLEDESTLVAQLPLDARGDVLTTARGAAVHAAALTDPETGEVQLPHLDLLLTAPTARVMTANWTLVDSAADDHMTDPPNYVDGGSDWVWVDEPEVHLREQGQRFVFLVDDARSGGAVYEARPAGVAGRLDVLQEEKPLTYTSEPEWLDRAEAASADTFRFGATETRFQATGDLLLMVFDAETTILSTNGTIVHRSGRWVEDVRSPVPGASEDDVLIRKTTTAYTLIELHDATLSLGVSGGDHGLYAAAGDLLLEVDGSIATQTGAGSLKVGDHVVRATGETARAEGTFTLIPTYVVDRDDREVVFSMQADLTALTVGAATYDAADATVAATGVALIAALVAAYFWPSLKMGLVAPLYAKLTRDKVLDQDTRSHVHAKVAQDPGCQVQDVADALSVSWTTAAYHIRVLRKMGLVVARQKGRHTHLFVAGSEQASRFTTLAALKNETARDIVSEVMRRPGIIQKEICERLGIAASTASWHLSRLRDQGLIAEEREWKKRRYFAGPALDDVPVRVGGDITTPLGPDTAVLAGS